MTQDRHRFRIVVIARKDEAAIVDRNRPAPARTLMIIETVGGRPTIVAKNDDVVLRADEGGQCDPFEYDHGGGITVKGPYFTIENGVACGQHWTDYVTFTHMAGKGFVFSNERIESWTLNPDMRPGQEALIRSGPVNVRKADPRRPVPLKDWRRTK